ncbi:MAG: dihydrodipicolinate synthase family protein [Phycisphaerales bacterium]
MPRSDGSGVCPAITTPFTADDAIDLERFGAHAAWMAGHGCTAIATPGSHGEGGLLSLDEKRALWRRAVEALPADVPVVAAVGACGTRESVEIARAAAESGCRGLMVLPPYAYRGDWREMRAHFGKVFEATPLGCMLYNNPPAYGVDVLPAQVEELVRAHPNLHAVKESSGDIRRFTAIRGLVGDRAALFVGIDDMVLEGVAAGAEGWIAGLVNGFPAESVRLFELARDGRTDEADELYRWFLPLLRLDAVPEFVHLVKLAQARAGWGAERVRQPRLPLDRAARDRAMCIIDACMKVRPAIAR